MHVRAMLAAIENLGITKLNSFSAKDQDQAPIIFGIFLVSQVLDALFTYGGVNELGVDVEMNVLLAHGMRTVGTGLTLTIAKIVACLCGFFLYYTARHRTLAVAAGLSIGVAVVPWCVVFLW
jgi:hypothetical protein